jgi:hypothetical protein
MPAFNGKTCHATLDGLSGEQRHCGMGHNATSVHHSRDFAARPFGAADLRVSRNTLRITLFVAVRGREDTIATADT